MPPSNISMSSIGQMEQVMVMLKVDHLEKIFMVHKGILCDHSLNFKSALSGPWSEAQENIHTLPDVDAEIFESFILDWFYRGTFPKQTDLVLVEGYMFADEYDVPELREQIVRAFYMTYVWEDGDELPSYRVIEKAFNGLPDSCKLCKLFLDLYGSRWDPTHNDEDDIEIREKLPPAFVRPLLVILGRRKPEDEYVEYLTCYQEEHMDTEH